MRTRTQQHDDEVAARILAAVRQELVFHFITGRGSQQQTLRAIARVLKLTREKDVPKKHSPQRYHRAAGVMFALKRGQTLHREYRAGAECWWLSDGTRIKTKVGREVATCPHVTGDDGLFVGSAQTYRYRNNPNPEIVE
jgi:hypothetical protein